MFVIVLHIYRFTYIACHSSVSHGISLAHKPTSAYLVMSSCSDTTGWSSLEPLGTPPEVGRRWHHLQGRLTPKPETKSDGVTFLKIAANMLYPFLFGANGPIFRGVSVSFREGTVWNMLYIYICFVPRHKYCLFRKTQTLESRLVSQNLREMQVNLSWEAVTPRKINMEPDKTPPGRGKSSSKPSFSGSMLILFNLRGCIVSSCSVQILEDWEIHWRFWNPNGRLSEDHPAMLKTGRQLPLTWLQCEHFESLWPACEHGHVKPHIWIIMLKLAVRWWISSINSAHGTFCHLKRRNICCHWELIMPFFALSLQVCK